MQNLDLRQIWKYFENFYYKLKRRKRQVTFSTADVVCNRTIYSLVQLPISSFAYNCVEIEQAFAVLLFFALFKHILV